MKQLDVNNSFLHGNLKETIYMEQPPRLEDPKFLSHVCLLKWSLYGLKPAPRTWFECLTQTLLQLGFHCSKVDASLFIYNNATNILLVLFYVDDVIIRGNNNDFLQNVIHQLSSTFALKDVGKLWYFFGIEVRPFKEGIFLSQMKYINDLLIKAHMLDCFSIATPMSLKDVQLPNDNNLTDAIK